MANRTIEELEKTYLSDASANEFDSWIARFKRKQRIRWTVSCAGLLLIVMFLGKSVKTYNTLDSYAEITTVELIETISALTGNSLDEINSINAKPGRNGIVVTAEFKNGITKTYLMKRGADGSSIEMTAHAPFCWHCLGTRENKNQRCYLCYRPRDCLFESV